MDESAATPPDERPATPADEGAGTPVDEGAATPVDEGAAALVDEGAATLVDVGPGSPADEGAATASLPLALLLAGAVAGVVAAAADFSVGVFRVSQFLPGPMGRLTLLLFLMGLYGLFGAVTGLGLGLVGLLLGRGSDLGPLWRRAWSRLARGEPGAEGGGLALTAWAVVVPLALGGAALLTFAVALTCIVRFHHPGLIAALVAVVAVLVTVACAVVAFPLQRAVLGLLRLVGTGAMGRRLGSPVGAALVFALVCGLPLPIIAALTWETTQLLPFRPFIIAFVYLAAVVLAAVAGRRLRLPLKESRWGRRGVALVVLVVLAALTVVAGRFERVRKAAASYAAFGTPLIVAARRVVDLDRDGYAAILGGHDCDDLNAAINPAAFDWPDDGVDQNCNGLDAVVRRAKPPPRSPVPASVPHDLNILLITIDALRADHVGCYGYPRPTTPTIDAIGREGAVFEASYAHAPSTRYSMPAIITGRYPSRIAWGTAWWPNVLPENPRISVALKRAGYYTGAILNYRYFSKIRQFDIGFDHYDNSNARLHHGRSAPATHGSSSREQTDAAIAFVTKHQHRKHFLWMHYYDPHWYYERHPEDPTTDFTGGAVPTGDRARDQIDIYDGEIRFTDNHLRRLIAHLKSLGLYDRTIIVITGDHGEGFGEHGIDLHGYHLYNAQTRVPIIARVPGLGPQRPQQPVAHIDIAPSLVDLARAQPEPRFLGRSFVDLLVNGTGPARHIFQEVMYEGPTVRKTIVTRQHKLIYNAVPHRTFELYDMVKDPQETKDLWGTAAVGEVGRQLKERLLAWMEEGSIPEDWHERVDPAIRRPGQQRFAPKVPLDAELGDALTLVGYDLRTPTVRRGGVVEVTWYFDVRKRLPGEWRIFVHLVGPTFLNADHDPVEGMVKLSYLTPGMQVADRQRIQIPPRARGGRYQIFLGVFAGRTRLPVRGTGADPQLQRVLAAEVTVR